MIDMTGQRSAPIEEFVVAGTTYRGANPQYVNIGKPETPHFVKSAKGVPWRKVKDN